MTIIHTKRVMRYDPAEGVNRVVEYRISDSPEFYCHTGQHSWYEEENAEKCCHDGWTQGLVRGHPVLTKEQFCSCPSCWVVTGTNICLCCGKLKL